jgi:hypothetical protein
MSTDTHRHRSQVRIDRRTGAFYIPLPPAITDVASLRVGDRLDVHVNDDGSVVITRSPVSPS